MSESLRAYRDRVAGDLEEARRAAREATERAQKVGILEKELAETEALLDKMGGGRRALPLLEDVKIAAPCNASWDQMVGDDRIRFCGQCEKNVYNLSAMPRDEAESLLLAKEGNMCVRLYKRADGTVLTDDCPVGVKRRRRRRAALATVGGGLLAAAAALGASAGRPLQGSAVAIPVEMGEPIATAMGSTTAAPPETTATPPAVTGHLMGVRAPVRAPSHPQQTMGKPAPQR
ncbi:MAG TPA: hypothetical protein VIF15_21405 [Polyangiaceae bacterium]